jgi:Fe-S-cluster containining protein
MIARRWTLDEIETSREYWADCVFLASACRPVGAEGDVILLECANYDTAHQACRAYDRRPPVCSNYPWYGGEPGSSQWIERNCSYLLDVPPSERPEGARPLIPLTPI